MNKHIFASIFAGLSAFCYEFWLKDFLIAHKFLPAGPLQHAIWAGVFTAIVCLLLLALLKRLRLIS